MFKLYREAFKVTNDGIVLAIPLTLFWWLITMYIGYSRAVVDSVPEVVLSAVTMIFMASTFFSGWFYLVKKCITFSSKEFILDKDRKKETLQLIKAIPEGIGKYFLHYVTASMLFVAIALLIVFLIKVLSFDSVRTINGILIEYGLTSDSVNEVKTGLDNLSQDAVFQIFNKMFYPAIKLAAVVFIVPAIFSFLLMLWMPEIIYTGKNPFVAIFTSIKKIFKHFGKSLKIFIYITIIQMILSFISPFSLLNIIFYMLMMLLYFYFLVYVVVLVFVYYETTFEQNITK